MAPLLSRAPELTDEYAFVAKITHLSTPMFRASAERDTTDDGATEIVIGPADVIVAVGQCVEISKLGE